MPAYSKLFGCNIHGSIRVSPMALRIIDTPEFQRLREIQQLGVCSFVFPAARHTRFEHSIGVYHLAGQMLDKIRKLYPNREYDVPELGGKIRLNNFYADLIMIGGLCHDIGHGPFSHIFDDIILENSNHPNKSHETRSCLIIEIIIRRELKGVLNDSHIAFIKSIINPGKEHKHALYQIVSNSLNGIDVDKFDYLSRDTHNLSLLKGIDIRRITDEIIIDENDNICYPKHCASNILELFNTRYMMHKQIYNHKTVKIIECMIADIIKKIDPIFRITESISDMNHFCRLTDVTIFQYISMTINNPPCFSVLMTEEEHQIILSANKIVESIRKRKLYKLVTELINEDITRIDDFFKENPTLNQNDFHIVYYKIGFVSGSKPDPFSTIFFYDKKEDKKSFIVKKDKISGILGDTYQEKHILLICKKRWMYPTVISLWKEFENRTNS